MFYQNAYVPTNIPKLSFIALSTILTELKFQSAKIIWKSFIYGKACGEGNAVKIGV